MTTFRAWATAAWLATASTALPAHAVECAPQLHGGWVRLPPMAMPMMAGFGRIENGCGAPVAIIGASSPMFGEVSLHETRIVEGITRMRAVPALRIAPGSDATLAPGGMHLMLMQPRATLKAGSKVVVDFALQDGHTLRGEFVVRTPAE